MRNNTTGEIREVTTSRRDDETLGNAYFAQALVEPSPFSRAPDYDYRPEHHSSCNDNHSSYDHHHSSHDSYDYGGSCDSHHHSD
jgi:hypothetical protein